MLIQLTRERLALLLSVLIWLVLVLHLSALKFFLYWHFWWYDNILHFLGGLWLAGATLWFIYYSGYVIWRPSPSKLLWILLGSVLVVGAGWEVYEYVLGASYSGEGYLLDTILDFVADLLGGLVGYLLVSKFTNHSVINQKI